MKIIRESQHNNCLIKYEEELMKFIINHLKITFASGMTLWIWFWFTGGLGVTCGDDNFDGLCTWVHYIFHINNNCISRYNPSYKSNIKYEYSQKPTKIFKYLNFWNSCELLILIFHNSSRNTYKFSIKAFPPNCSSSL